MACNHSLKPENLHVRVWGSELRSDKKKKLIILVFSFTAKCWITTELCEAHR